MQKQTQKGFTLIELLVVIAVIGVLAAIVLIAIDPLEQINRGKDASLKDKVSQVGNAAQAAYTASGANGTASYPLTGGTSGTQQDNLVASGDLKAQLTDVTYVGCASGTCTSMVAYAKLLSKQSATNAASAGAGTATGASPTCVAGTTGTVYFVYQASNTTTSKTGWFCGGTAPTAASTIY